MASRPRPGCARRRCRRSATRCGYLYSAIVSAHEAHTPVLAPTFVAFEDDPVCFADADAAMFGPCLLAAPALRDGAREVEVYLPRGPESWRDFWTGRVYAAGQIATIPAPLDRLPLLAPAGAIVAMTDNGDDYSRLHDEPSRGLRVFRVPPTAHRAPFSSKTTVSPSSAPRPAWRSR